MNEIHVFQSGATNLFAVIRNGAGLVWYPTGQVFETWGTGARTAGDYDIALTDKSGGMFVGDFDTNIAVGLYIIVGHQQAGGLPDDADPAIYIDQGYWTGSVWTSNVLASDVAAILEDTGTTLDGKLNTAQADLDIITGTNGVLIDDAAITADAFDNVTAFPVEKVDSGATEIARTGADGDTLETLSDQIDAIKVQTDRIRQRKGPFV